MSAAPPAPADLLAASLAAKDEDVAWERITELHLHPDPAAVRALVEPLLTSADAAEREVAVDVIGQLDARNATDASLRELADLLLPLLEGETEWRVLESLGYALGSLNDERGAPGLAAHAAHPEVRVRRAVVDGLLRVADPRAVAPLIALSADPDDDVRDWATFGLGSMGSPARATPQVADALAARLDDPHVDTRVEAITGLVHRRDPRAIGPLVALVHDGWEGPMIESALAILAQTSDDPRLPGAIAAYFPDGLPDAVRERAADELAFNEECLRGLAS